VGAGSLQIKVVVVNMHDEDELKQAPERWTVQPAFQVRSIEEGNRVNVAMRTAMACAAFGGVLLAFFLFEHWLASSKMSKAKEAISQMLFDPDSAQFHDLRRAKRIGGREVICGEVNAKNKLGGYVGRQPFAYDPSIGVAVFLAADSWRSYQEYFLACGVPNPAPWRSRGPARGLSVSSGYHESRRS
jgi:hypothetical protein